MARWTIAKGDNRCFKCGKGLYSGDIMFIDGNKKLCTKCAGKIGKFYDNKIKYEGKEKHRNGQQG